MSWAEVQVIKNEIAKSGQLIIVTAEDFAEETITLTNADDGTTLTKTADANGVAKFNVSSAGTWTATADDSGTTVTLGSVTLNVSEINYASNGVKFAFHYSENDSDPDSVTYPAGYDNSNWDGAPAHMDFANNRFEYGAWDPDGANASKLEWLFPKPCMLAYDGTASYYLDKNDYTKKSNGTASDVANTSFGGNAMMEWGQDGKKIYWKIVPDSDGKGFTFCVANHEADADYHCWNHYDCDNNIKDHFYTPIYFGSLVSSKLRSLSGQSNSLNTTVQNEINYAKANNPDANVHWYTEVYADWLLTDLLTVLITKSLNSQSKVGTGRTASGNTSAINTGTMNDKGLFWGANNGTNGVKAWGMENPWGNCWRRIAGMILSSHTIKTKLTYGTADETSVSAYNLDGTGYTSLGSVSGTSGGYVSHMNISTKGIAPASLSGSDSTYYTDSVFIASGTVYAFVGGGWGAAKASGLFCTGISVSQVGTEVNLGASISYK